MKITVIGHCSITPPNAGGKIRIYNLLHALPKDVDIEYYALSAGQLIKSKTNVDKNFAAYVLPQRLLQVVSAVFVKILHTNFDFVIPILYKKRLPKAVTESINNADVVLVEHPWFFRAIKNSCSKKIILTCHNIESDLYKQTFGGGLSFFKKKIVTFVKKVETEAVQQADVVVCTSKNDFAEIHRIRGEKRTVIISNGTSEHVLEDTHKWKHELGIEINKTVAIFIGSDHIPNQESLKIIERYIAPQTPNVLFIIVGAVSRKRRINNIICTGKVADTRSFLLASDIAINPIVSGSGSNLKVIEALAYGLPTISTPFGVRGFEDIHDLYEIADIDAFPKIILEKQHATKKISDRISKYYWRNLADELYAELKILMCSL